MIKNTLPKVHAAVDRLVTLPHDELASLVCEAAKDFDGVKRRSSWEDTQEQLVNWWLGHYDFNENTEVWEFKEELF